MKGQYFELGNTFLRKNSWARDYNRLHKSQSAKKNPTVIPKKNAVSTQNKFIVLIDFLLIYC